MRGLFLVRPERTQLALLVEHAFHALGPDGPGQLVFEVACAGVEPHAFELAAIAAAQRAQEVPLLADVVKAGESEVAVLLEETRQVAVAPHRHDGDARGFEIATAATRERLHSTAIAHPFDQDYCAHLHHCIKLRAVPFTLRNIKGDLEDLGARFDGAPDLEFRAATKALALEQSALSYQRVPPGYRFPYGHTHRTQEEVYVVVRGSGRMKVDDEIVEVEEWDAVRVPPGTWRGYEAGPRGLEILVIGAPNLGKDPREDVEGQRDWWAD
jgi:mannose-6-phosphate isomerase-like protein (cupin superfamily)